MSKFIQTKTAKDIWRILEPGVEWVHWKRRKPSPSVTQSICSFNSQTEAVLKTTDWDQVHDTARQEGFPRDQIIIIDDEREQYPELCSLWNSLNSIRSIVERALCSSVYPVRTFIQKPQRQGSDSIFHRDRASQNEEDAIYFFIPHHLGGTQAIPSEDAGHQTFMRDTDFGEVPVFTKPKSLSRVFQVHAPDILIGKSGSLGTIHRAPYRAEGNRIWSFTCTHQTIPQIREYLGMD